MGPRVVEGNSFVIGVKPVGSESGTGFFKGVKGFPSVFDFVIAFPMDKELAFLAIDSIFENLFNFPIHWSRGIDGDWFFGGGFREAWECFEIWSKVDSKVTVMDPRVYALHDGREVQLVVILFVRAFEYRERS